MSANTEAVYPKAPYNGSQELSAANTARDGSGTLTSLLAGGDNGARADRIVIKAIGTTRAGMVRFFLDGALVLEVPVTASTPSVLTPTFSKEVVHVDAKGNPDGEPLFLVGPGDTLMVTSHVADNLQVHVFGGQY